MQHCFIQASLVQILNFYPGFKFRVGIFEESIQLQNALPRPSVFMYEITHVSI